MIMTDDTEVTTPITPPAHQESSCEPSPEPSRRETIITRMQLAARRLQRRGLRVHPIPAGGDTIDCGAPIMQLAVTNPDAPGQGRVLITRDLQTLTAKLTSETWHPLPNDTAIQHLTDHVARILGGPDPLTTEGCPPVTTGQAAPGDLMRLVATGLTARGVDVRLPEHDDERRLMITAPPGMGCALTIDDCGTVEWAYWPRRGHHAEPSQITHLALTVLIPSPHRTRRSFPSSAPSTKALRCDVGQQLKAAGLKVGLDVYVDQDTFNVIADLVAASPDHPERGQIRVSDGGRLTWECGYDPVAIPAPLIAESVVGILADELTASPAG